MKTKFLPSYVQYNVAATEQGDGKSKDPKSIGIKASALFNKQPEALQADWDNEDENEDEDEEHNPQIHGDESHPHFSQWGQHGYNPIAHDELTMAGGDMTEIETQVEPEWPAEDGIWHQEGGEENHEEENHEDAEEDPNGWYLQ
jgi:hypothetical protein